MVEEGALADLLLVDGNPLENIALVADPARNFQVIMKDGKQPLTVDAMKAYCKDQLAHYKVPRYLDVVTEYPMTVTGKLQKFRMRELALEKMRASGMASSGAPA